MKTENDFNAYLSKELRRLSPGLHFVKASDKFTVGIADFLLWRGSRSAAMETKFVREIPGDNALLLKHEFGGAQATFLESIGLTGNGAFGLVGIGSVGTMYLIPWKNLKPNWKVSEFKTSGYTAINIKDVPLLAQSLFTLLD